MSESESSDSEEESHTNAAETVKGDKRDAVLKLQDQVLSFDFHPSQDNLVSGLISGHVCLHSYPASNEEGSPPCQQLLNLQYHEDATRCVLFSVDGAHIFSGSKDKSIAMIDAVTGKSCWRQKEAHADAVNCILNVAESIIASGDDAGAVLLWDVRQKERVMRFHVNTDFISNLALLPNTSGDLVLAASGDCTLSAFDLKQRKVVGRSDDQEDELLSVCVVKNGRKVVCGSQNGTLLFFSAGEWGDCSDRFPGHPQSIDSLFKLDESTVLTGSSDGIIRVVGLHPNKLLGVLGDHDNFPVEQLKMSHDRKFIGTSSHDEIIRFWDASILDDDGEEDDDEEEEDVQDGAHASSAVSSPNTEQDEGDDDNEDGDDDDDDGKDDEDGDDDDEDGDGDDVKSNKARGAKRKRPLLDDGGKKSGPNDDDEDSDEDSDDGGGGASGGGGRTTLLTASERFFADL